MLESILGAATALLGVIKGAIGLASDSKRSDADAVAAARAQVVREVMDGEENELDRRRRERLNRN